MPAKEFALSMQGVNKTYRIPSPFPFTAPVRQIEVLHEINLSIPKGEILTLMGPNGAGKTTLLKIISSLVIPDAGSFKLFGKVPSKGRISLSFVLGDERSFYWRLTGRQNLEFFGTLYEIPARQLAAKIQEAAKLFEIEDLDKRYEVYSTGQKCRLALARSFMAQAELILMDEPTRSLDHNSKVHLHQVIKQMNKDLGTTFLIVTHDINEAETLGGLFATLQGGRLHLVSSFEEFSKEFHLTDVKT